MHIEIQTRGLELGEQLRDFIRRRLAFGLDRASRELGTVFLSLSDINGPRGGNDKLCRLRIPLPRMRDVVIEEIADDPHVAIARAVDRAARNLQRRRSRSREFGPLVMSAKEV